jgi:hypothetical protein
VVQYLWATTFLLQAAVCAILISRGHFRRLPFFTAYVALNLCQAVFLYLIYNYYHINWHTTFRAGWWSEAITLVARAFATVEVLHLVLASYRGIWGLAWRLLAGTSLLVLICVSLASGGDARWALMEADRGYHLIFATALIACLVMIRYYGIQVATVYKVLLGGFCFYSCIKILINTVLQLFLYRQFVLFYPTWQAVVMFSFLIVVTSWAVALWRPLPATAAQRAVLPASVYLRISPEINRQLQAINKQLMNFFEIEERRQ